MKYKNKTKFKSAPKTDERANAQLKAARRPKSSPPISSSFLANTLPKTAEPQETNPLMRKTKLQIEPNERAYSNQANEKTNSDKPADSNKKLMMFSFAFMGFIFAFLTGFGHFDLIKAIGYGCYGGMAGACLGALPYLYGK